MHIVNTPPPAFIINISYDYALQFFYCFEVYQSLEPPVVHIKNHVRGIPTQ